MRLIDFLNLLTLETKMWFIRPYSVMFITSISGNNYIILIHGFCNFCREIGALMDELVDNAKKIVSVTSKELEKWRRWICLLGVLKLVLVSCIPVLLASVNTFWYLLHVSHSFWVTIRFLFSNLVEEISVHVEFSIIRKKNLLNSIYQEKNDTILKRRN